MSGQTAARAARPVTPTTILAAELDDLVRALDGADGAPGDLADRLRRARDLAAGLDRYVADCTTPESEDLARLAARTAETDWANRDAPDGAVFLEQEMLSGHVEGQALKFLVRLSGARRVLEIGMFTGYSALAMAEALPADGSLLACEVDEEVARFAQQSFGVSPAGQRITVAVGPAMDTLRALAQTVGGEPFDFVFIDADKAGYLDYVDYLLDSPLLSPDAVIVVDNTLMQGQPYLDQQRTANGEAISAFNRAIADDPRVEQVLLPLRDGVTLIRRAGR
ncbi:O-methyltransferase [Mycolicibacterium bacteremicum]|uniref:SAM-dependent methyltransferase n=1 Tax=Mycolicibacterium bacteremicum TaxID=564198 RepID=A0A1W9Z0U6_MYCBA|nr:class I SAM-dependent methyltransferase [Mycolicibacterium bacteremicum]MCV7432465.1 class I SAM-dependent methyltransferase [Mycolicibacterium bacteremicum]ORA05958.1 SAM-dependent methyltransferase [Mycolicibacterium bacteremicum]